MCQRDSSKINVANCVYEIVNSRFSFMPCALPDLITCPCQAVLREIPEPRRRETTCGALTLVVATGTPAAVSQSLGPVTFW